MCCLGRAIGTEQQCNLKACALGNKRTEHGAVRPNRYRRPKLREIFLWGRNVSAGMIKLTRLDGEQFVLNADLIRYVEQRPDTFITLTTGERFVVAETLDRVVELAVDYQQRKHLIPAFANYRADHIPSPTSQ